MQYYTFLKRFIAIIVILYFLIGNFTWSRYQLEVFPIYSWDLFSYIPNLSVDYALKINAIDQTYLETPKYFQEMPNEFSDSGSIVAYHVIQSFGRAVESSDAESIKNLRNQIESTYFSNHLHVEYEVRRRTFYAGERWRDNRFEENIRLATYDTTIP